MNKKYLNQKDREKLFNTWVAHIGPCVAVVLPTAGDLKNRAAALENSDGNASITASRPVIGDKSSSDLSIKGALDAYQETDDVPNELDDSDKIDAATYLNRLQDMLENQIPPFVRKIAVTKFDSAPIFLIRGLLKMLQQLKNTRFDMIYFNTNGAVLPQFEAQDIYKAFHGLNISLSPRDTDNRLQTATDKAQHASIKRAGMQLCGEHNGLQTDGIMSDGATPAAVQHIDLKSILKPLRANMICILHYTFEGLISAPKTPDAFVKYAKDLGFYALTLRFKPSSVLYMGDLPDAWEKYPTIKYALSPDCRVWVKKKGDYPFVIRSTALEPKNENNYTYGYIIQPDLSLSQDWAGKVPFAEKRPTFKPAL